jgi:uncharacterized protein (DUF983 family)
MGFSMKAAWNYKCPRCRQGDIFIKPLNLKNPLAMPEKCQYCGQKTEPEIGFYYGAMMVSYAISSWLFLGIVLFLVFYYKWTVESAMLVVIALAVVTYLWLLRYSRSLWLHLMEKHKPEVEERVKLEIANKTVEQKEWKPRISKKKQ